MSRTIRKELFATLDTLKKANGLIRTSYNKANERVVFELLSDCQEAAIAIGSRIEELYGQGLECIHILENYCEILFQIAESSYDKTEFEKYCAASEKHLLMAEAEMQIEIPDKQEVVFFPYKASMWDSLESVYLEAKKAPNCDAYCVPIPYFDRNADGSLGKMHYEGEEYPADIEIVNWEQYNFESRRPDVVYIHNPYDENNFVTCVHPRYFSSNLKKYTEKLVYIPYFLLQEIEANNQGMLAGMKHFCFLPGVIYADTVIVQSEDMRQIYINEYIKAARANNLTGQHVDRKYLEQKILGLGSPKIDKVLNTKRENLEIPEAWLNIIQKQDGSWKKIIFYNVSINGLLQHGEAMIDKMKAVFRLFKENQDEVALLWRPHPLIESTIKSMRPRLWEGYRQVVDAYLEEGWGIYDDTSDMDRAVVLSDAYYGDGSSIVELYRGIGKKILIQSVSDGKGLNALKYAYSFAACSSEEYCYLAAAYDNTIFVFDKIDHKIVDCIETGSNNSLFGISEVIDAGNHIIAIPYSNSTIYYISKRDKQAKSLKIVKKDARAAYAGCLVEDKVWILPLMNGDAMYSLDTDSLALVSTESVFKKFNFTEAMLSEYGHPIFTRLKVINQMIWFAMWYEGKLFRYDTANGNWSQYEIAMKIVDFTLVGEQIWLLSDDAVLYRWRENEELQIACEIDRDRIQYIERISYLYVTYANNWIWCLPYYSNVLFAYNVETKEKKYITLCDNERQRRICSTYTWDGNKLCIFSQEIGVMWIIDSQTFEMTTVELNIPLPTQQKMLNKNRIWKEEQVPLEFLWNNMISNNQGKMPNISDEMIGRKIYEHVLFSDR